MKDYFDVWLCKDYVYIKPRLHHLQFRVYVNNTCITNGLCNSGVSFYLGNPKPNAVLTIEYLLHHQLKIDRYLLQLQVATRSRNYQPGDILVSSDNVKSLLTGYIGHSAIIINERELIESRMGEKSALVKDSIQQFNEKHPVHAHFRPIELVIGKKAAAYAMHYLLQYHDNLKKGLNMPIYSFQLSQSLDDPWEKIYCSKLVWLSYHYGADYTFDNDYLWFSPEDLYSGLMKNKDFQLRYKHPDVSFYINT